jgi:parallel beta-helix repeat protein
MFASVETASAAGTVGDGTAASCTEAALNAALAGGGNVYFNCGSSPLTIPVTTEKVISANTLIDGGANGNNLITLSGGNSKSIFNLQGSIQFSVKNLTLANGFTTEQGAAINNSTGGTLSVSNCQFTNNVSNKPGEFGGGAIFSGPRGTVTVAKSTFNGNKGSIGGAIRILNSNLSVTSSTFTGNSAVDGSLGNGGALYIDGANGNNGKITIRATRFTNNTATAYGGAFFNNIYNNNQTLIDRSTFSGNKVAGGSNGQGGAIWSMGDPAPVGGIWTTGVNNTTLTVTNTTIAGNTASQQGGGIWLGRHPAGINISNTTVSGNTATSSNGGGIVLGDNGKLNITNSTISGNKVAGSSSLGGGLAIANGQATITNSTIASNTAVWQGGGIFGGTKVTLKNTIVANNTANNGGNNWNIKHNCFDAVTDGGNNLQFTANNPSATECGAAISMADPKLGPLASNGGLTRTMALLAGSLAINAGNNTGCPTTDQRGITRPQGPACDIGAFEVQ